MIYCYARVSTDGQNVDAEVRQLLAAGGRQVFRETASRARTDRAQFRRVLGQLAAITERNAVFQSPADTWAGTTPAHGRLMPTVPGGLAEFERELMRDITPSYNVSHNTISRLDA